MVRKFSKEVRLAEHPEGIYVETSDYEIVERQRDELMKVCAVLQSDAKRYAKIRRMSPRDFAELWRYNLEGAAWKTFDELVDAWGAQ